MLDMLPVDGLQKGEHTGMLRTFKDVQVAIVGIGRSNQALCRYLLKEGAVVTCFDRKAKEELGDTYPVPQ